MFVKDSGICVVIFVKSFLCTVLEHIDHVVRVHLSTSLTCLVFY